MASNPAKTCRLRFDYTGGYPDYPKDAASRIPSDPGKADLHAVFPGCIAGDSHPGFEREKNEDSYLICTRPDGHLSLAAVADGVGGRPCGEIASRLCLSTLFEQWSRMAWNVPSLDPKKEPPSSQPPRRRQMNGSAPNPGNGNSRNRCAPRSRQYCSRRKKR